MSEITVALIGGYGGMGRLFARFFRENGCRVIVSGPTKSKGEAFASEIEGVYVKDNREAAGEGDVVVVTVPIRKTVEVIREVAGGVRPGCLLMDLTSVKSQPVEAMTEYSGVEVEVVGCHPVFGPSVQGVEGQVCVLTPVKEGRWFKWFKSLLEESKAKVIKATPKEHDEVMAVVQGLTHFTYISVAEAFRRLDFNVKGSRRYSSPVYDLMLDMIGRIIGQDPRLYAEIQMNNPRIPGVHETYLEAAGDIARMVAEGDEKGFVEYMASSARHYGDTDAAMGRSDKAINSLVYELRKLKDKVGEKVCVRHIYSGVMHYGIVDEVDAHTLTLVDSGVKSRLKLSNIRLTSSGEAAEYRRRKYGLVQRDYSIILSGDALGDDVAGVFERMLDVYGVKVHDVYRGEGVPEGFKSLTLRVSHFGEVLDQGDHDVKELVDALGWSLR